MWNMLKSNEDASVNFIKDASDGGIWESRFVQRVPEYFIIYLSSHSGCNKACRFCHLTATKQKMMLPATINDYLEQADQGLNYYSGQDKEQTESIVNFNFMARGEPLANLVIKNNSSLLFSHLGDKAEKFNLRSQFMVSSIIPADFSKKLEDVLKDERSTLYYSLYSVDDKFRKRWLPKAMDCYRALDMIANYQVKTNRPIVLHWAFIEGENDNIEMLHKTMEAVTSRGITARFNQVRYNPFSERFGNEPQDIKLEKLFKVVQQHLPESENKVVSRVGHDVKASCGMFVTK